MTPLPGFSQVFYRKKHMRAHKDALRLLPEAIAKIRDGERKQGVHVITLDLGRIVGLSGCVKTTESDDVVYAYRPGRHYKSRMVRGRTGDPTSNITLVVNIQQSGWFIITAWVGSPAPKEPGDTTLTDAEREVSQKFWAEHALIM